MMLKYLLTNEWTKATDYLAIDNEGILYSALGKKKKKTLTGEEEKCPLKF